MHRSHRTEVLAPAGGWSALEAAIASGADAVYFGLQEFNARFRAENFSLEELPRVALRLHEGGRREVRGQEKASPVSSGKTPR